MNSRIRSAPTLLPVVAFALTTLSGNARAENEEGLMFAAAHFAAGDEVFEVAVADLDGDGVSDLVVSNAQSDGGVSVLVGLGNGWFGAPASVSTGAEPRALVLGDLDGDENVDLVTANFAGDDLSVALGSGDGTFGAASAIPAGSAPIEVEAADLDGDGALDLVVVLNGDDAVGVLAGTGGGGFDPVVLFPVGAGPEDVAIADLDNDGHLDLVTANRTSDDLSILLGVGGGDFAPAAHLPIADSPGAVNTLRVEAGELSGDQDPDLIVITGGAPFVAFVSAWFLEGRGDGTFEAGELLDVGNGPWRAAIADVDDDGANDLAFALVGAGDDVSVVRGAGSGTFVAPTLFDASRQPVAIATADLDGDGDLDLVAGNRDHLSAADDDVTVLLGDGTGFFGPQELLSPLFPDPLGVILEDVAIGDLDGDGVLDVAVADWGTHTMFTALGAGDGTFGATAVYDTGQDPTAIAIGRLDGDTAPDIVVTNAGHLPTDGNISIFFGQGGGAFDTHVVIGTGDNPRGVAIVDVDGDGDFDIGTANSGSDDVSVFLGDGGGSFGNDALFGVGTEPYDLAAADFDGDGAVDLTTPNRLSNDATVLFGAGDGTFGGALTLAAGLAPWANALGDFDRDGAVDIAIANRNESRVSIHLGRGDGSFSSPAFFDAVAFPDSLAVGDLNDDGLSDIALAGDEDLVVLLGNGDGSFGPPASFPTGFAPRGVGIADIDGDARDDALVLNASSGDVSLMLNESPPREPLCAGPASVSTSAGGTQLFSLVAGSDFAGDVYLVLGSITGTTPGVALGPFHLPLNPDPYFLVTITDAGAPPLVQTVGFLDANGASELAAFALPAASNPAFAGLHLDHAAVALDPVTSALVFVSNAVGLDIVP